MALNKQRGVTSKSRIIYDVLEERFVESIDIQLEHVREDFMNPIPHIIEKHFDIEELKKSKN